MEWWGLPDLISEINKKSKLPSPKIRRILAQHKKVFLTVGLGVLLVSAVRACRQVDVPLWSDNLGLSPATTSIIYGVSSAIERLVFYRAGKVMDRKGRVAVAVPSMVLMGVALLLMPFTTGAVSLLIVAMVVGFGNGIAIEPYRLALDALGSPGQ